MNGYDNWLQAPYMEEEEGCLCAGLNSTKPCPIHDPEFFGDVELDDLGEELAPTTTTAAKAAHSS